MSKVAIFVEGQTELIFVREFLLKKYQYQVSIECLKLFREGNLIPAEYSYSCPESEFFYKIINIGNDQKVLSAILERENSLFRDGFDKIIGLRDMYSKMYREKSMTINVAVNEEFIRISDEIKIARSINHDRIFLCFSIMEIESWFMALYHVFQKLHNDLTSEKISEVLNIDLVAIDPELDIFHPANEVNKIYGIAGLSYDKSKGDIEAVCRHLNIEDYNGLYASHKCESFNKFHDVLF